MNRIPSASFARLHSMIGQTVDTGRGFSVVITGHGVPGSMFCRSLDPDHPCYEISSGLVDIAWREMHRKKAEGAE